MKLNTCLPSEPKPIPVPSSYMYYEVPVLRTWLLAAAAFCGGEALLPSLTIVLLVRLVVKVCP